jgi:hypothetical protein
MTVATMLAAPRERHLAQSRGRRVERWVGKFVSGAAMSKSFDDVVWHAFVLVGMLNQRKHGHADEAMPHDS